MFEVEWKTHYKLNFMLYTEYNAYNVCIPIPDEIKKNRGLISMMQVEMYHLMTTCISLDLLKDFLKKHKATVRLLNRKNVLTIDDIK